MGDACTANDGKSTVLCYKRFLKKKKTVSMIVYYGSSEINRKKTIRLGTMSAVKKFSDNKDRRLADD